MDVDCRVIPLDLMVLEHLLEKLLLLLLLARRGEVVGAVRPRWWQHHTCGITNDRRANS